MPDPRPHVDRPGFDQPVPAHGYRWWYVDALSDDGAHGITVIAFLGSVFSPWYALSRRFGAGDPARHVALNVALYGRPRRWALTERAGATRSADALAIGRSWLRWERDALVVSVDEVGAPVPRRLRGEITIRPRALTGHVETLDAEGRHRWTPYAPEARVEVAFTQPALRWSGPGYLDGNDGDAPLERAFRRWHWARAPLADRTAILYDVERLDGSMHGIALDVARDGAVRRFDPPPARDLPRTRWRVDRRTRSEAGAAVVRTLEDTPFYARSVLRTTLLGAPVEAMAESLDLARFANPVVQAMLAFRMPRALRAARSPARLVR